MGQGNLWEVIYGCPVIRTLTKTIHGKPPNTAVIVAGNTLQGMVLKGCIGQRQGPTAFDQVGPQIHTLFEVASVHIADAVQATVVVFRLRITVHKTLYLEVQSQYRPPTATDRENVTAAVARSFRQVNAEQMHMAALDQQRTIVLDNGVAMQFPGRNGYHNAEEQENDQTKNFNGFRLFHFIVVQSSAPMLT